MVLSTIADLPVGRSAMGEGLQYNRGITRL